MKALRRMFLDNEAERMGAALADLARRLGRHPEVALLAIALESHAIGLPVGNRDFARRRQGKHLS
jgi:hypothetical protein